MATTTDLTTLKINYLTQAQYDALVQAGEVNPNEIYLTPENGSVTETDPIFTASPAHGITANDITNWNGKSNFSGSYNDLTNKPTIPTDTNELNNSAGFITLLDAVENNQASTYVLMVSGSSASLYSGSSPASFYELAVSYQSIAGARIGQVISGTAEQPEARVFEVAEVNYQTYSVSLVSIDNGVIYKADLQATDLWSALTGTFSSQTIPTGGITTETDPTVPAWAKASTKPTYTASEVGALASTGGQITGDLTLYVESGNSPAIIFQRGTLTDNYNDWKIYDKSGFLYFAQRGSGSSAFGDVGYINTSGVAYFHVPWSYVDSKPTFATVATSGSYNDLSDKPTSLPTVTSSDNGKVLRVVNGAWSAVALPSASGVSF